MPNQISLYVHVPFCTRKCDYCHFYVIPDKDPFKKQLMQGLELEWARWRPLLQDKQVATLYFGGGTPALLGAEAIGQIIAWIKRDCAWVTPDAEITLEANPENITKELMCAYAAVGINRVSIGIQTLDDGLLRVLGRQHNAAKAKEAVQLTAAAGITNISIDLMYDLPGQHVDQWQHTLEGVRELPITHLSLYNLTIEPHTVFFKYRKELQSQLPDPDASLQMVEMAIERLASDGLTQYEISAFARRGKEAQHNTGYWIGRPFLGLGPSAFSYWEGRRFRNVANLSRYTKALEAGESPVDFSEELLPIDRRRELLAIQLRLLAGVDLMRFVAQQGALDAETLCVLERLQHEGLLERKGDVVRLSRRGLLFYDTVATELV